MFVKNKNNGALSIATSLLSIVSFLLLVTSTAAARGAYWLDTQLEVVNADSSHMYIWIEGGGISQREALQPKESIRIPFPVPPSFSGGGAFNGALRAFTGCNPGSIGSGWGCTTWENTATKLEYTIHGWQGKDWFDISLVDGYNTRMQVEFIGSGHGCHDMTTYVPQQAVMNYCPSPNLIVMEGADGRDHASCQSDCKVADRSNPRSLRDISELCCLGQHELPGTCAPSNQHLRNWVHSTRSNGLAYLWAHDNKEQQDCYMPSLIRITLGGTGGASNSRSPAGPSAKNGPPQPEAKQDKQASSNAKEKPKQTPENKKPEHKKPEERKPEQKQPERKKPEQMKPDQEASVKEEKPTHEVVGNSANSITPKLSNFCWVVFNANQFGCHKDKSAIPALCDFGVA